MRALSIFALVLAGAALIPWPLAAIFALVGPSGGSGGPGILPIVVLAYPVVFIGCTATYVTSWRRVGSDRMGLAFAPLGYLLAAALVLCALAAIHG